MGDFQTASARGWGGRRMTSERVESNSGKGLFFTKCGRGVHKVDGRPISIRRRSSKGQIERGSLEKIEHSAH